jgi:ADP-heptose:LPS heptosyltransferase
MGIIPSGGWASKRCDKEKWVEIIRAFENRNNYRTLILWGPGDEEDAEYIKQNIPSVLLAPETDINKMAALIERCNWL